MGQKISTAHRKNKKSVNGGKIYKREISIHSKEAQYSKEPLARSFSELILLRTSGKVVLLKSRPNPNTFKLAPMLFGFSVRMTVFNRLYNYFTLFF